MSEEQILRKATEILRKLKEDKDKAKERAVAERQMFIDAAGKEIRAAVEPAVQQMMQESANNLAAIKDVVGSIEVKAEVDAPVVNLPAPKVNVTAPKPQVILDRSLSKEMRAVKDAISAQEIVFPKPRSIFDDVNLGFTPPIPVIQTDAKGKPVGQAGGGGGPSNVHVKEIFGSTATDTFTADGRLKVSTETGSTGLTDTELRASAVPVSQVSGANWSVEVTSFSGSVESQLIDADGNYRGTIPIEGTVTGITNSVSVQQLDADGAYRDTFPIEGTVTGITNTVSVQQVDADGAYRDVFPVEQVTVRSSTTTAYVTLTDSSEDTLLAGTSSTFYDLIYIMGANSSDATVTIDIRCGTGGAVVASLAIPANATQGVSLSTPIPMVEAAQAWTAQNNGSDISNTTVDVAALFDKQT
jgi:hypothetical protein